VPACSLQSSLRKTEALVKAAKVLIVDDEYYTRKVIRTLLVPMGSTPFARWRPTLLSSTGKCRS
jgi:hypothetical protein